MEERVWPGASAAPTPRRARAPDGRPTSSGSGTPAGAGVSARGGPGDRPAPPQEHSVLAVPGDGKGPRGPSWLSERLLRTIVEAGQARRAAAPRASGCGVPEPPRWLQEEGGPQCQRRPWGACGPSPPDTPRAKGPLSGVAFAEVKPSSFLITSRRHRTRAIRPVTSRRARATPSRSDPNARAHTQRPRRAAVRGCPARPRGERPRPPRGAASILSPPAPRRGRCCPRPHAPEHTRFPSSRLLLWDVATGRGRSVRCLPVRGGCPCAPPGTRLPPSPPPPPPPRTAWSSQVRQAQGHQAVLHLQLASPDCHQPWEEHCPSPGQGLAWRWARKNRGKPRLMSSWPSGAGPSRAGLPSCVKPLSAGDPGPGTPSSMRGLVRPRGRPAPPHKGSTTSPANPRLASRPPLRGT